MEEKKVLCKVKVFDKDGRMEVSPHPYQFAIPKGLRGWPVGVKRQLGSMSVACYEKNRKSTYRQLFARDYSDDKYYYLLTLTLRDRLNPNDKKRDIVYHVRRFLGNVFYHYPNTQYARAIEYTKKGTLHVHVILQFDQRPKLLRKQFVEKLWKLGLCNVKKVTNIYGALEYITLFKTNNIMKTDKGQYSMYTKFDKGTKIVCYSKDFGVPATFKTIYLTKEQVQELLEQNKGNFVRMEGHYFYNSSTKRKEHCLDRIYIKSKNRPNIDPLDQLVS